jgi:hypothetical protein
MKPSIAKLVAKHTGKSVAPAKAAPKQRRKRRAVALTPTMMAHSITNDFFYNHTCNLFPGTSDQTQEDRQDTNERRERFEDRYFNTVLTAVIKGIAAGTITPDMNTRPIPHDLYHKLAYFVR